MSTRLRQIVLVNHQLEPAREQFRTLFASGVGDVDPGMAEFDLAHEVLKVGRDTYLEICAPIHAEADTAATRFLRRGGDGGYMVVLQVPSAETLRGRIGELGLSIPVAQTYGGNELTQLHPKEFGTLLEADEVGSGHDWHYPAIEGTTNVSTTAGIVAIDVAVPDPGSMARRWVEVFDLDLGEDGATVRFDDGAVVRFVEQGDRSRPGAVAFEVTATDSGRVGEATSIGGVDVRFV